MEAENAGGGEGEIISRSWAYFSARQLTAKLVMIMLIAAFLLVVGRSLSRRFDFQYAMPKPSRTVSIRAFCVGASLWMGFY